MNKPNVKILVCTHKKAPCLNDEVYMPIQVGRLEVDFDLGFQTDAEGINIGHKHYTYSEFTGIYWAWKNLKNVDYIGWCHYRRYFCLNDNKDSFRELLNVDEQEFVSMDFSPHHLIKDLSKFDIILPRKKILISSVWNKFIGMHDIRNMLVIESIIKDNYPDYVSTFNKLLKRNNRLEYLSIFITRWEVFDSYCKWLFLILEQAEQMANPKTNTLDNERSIAFLAELLFPIFIHHNKYKIKHMPVAFINSNDKNKSWLRYQASNIKSTLRFWFNI